MTSVHVGWGRAAGNWVSWLWHTTVCQASARAGRRKRQGHRARHDLGPVYRLLWPTGVPGEFAFGHFPIELRDFFLGLFQHSELEESSHTWPWAPCEQGLWLSCSLLYPLPLKLCLAPIRGSVNICWMTEWTTISCLGDTLEHIGYKHELQCQTARIQMLTLPLTTLWP